MVTRFYFSENYQKLFQGQYLSDIFARNKMLILEPSQLRDELNYSANIRNLTGVKLLNRFDEFQKHFFDCYGYVCTELADDIPWFSESDATERASFLTRYQDVSLPRLGDLTIYFRDEEATLVGHYGIYEGSSLVRSKWGLGNVYLHPLSLIPSCYGDYVHFYRKIETQNSILDLDL